jgi:hypothetical protein
MFVVFCVIVTLYHIHILKKLLVCVHVCYVRVSVEVDIWRFIAGLFSRFVTRFCLLTFWPASVYPRTSNHKSLGLSYTSMVARKYIKVFATAKSSFQFKPAVSKTGLIYHKMTFGFHNICTFAPFFLISQ